ncbi:MAG: hypothetical protein K0S32_4335 [Bacteroidetes bacterium]|jgi:hypothetical protein|nr:hypothetical protein [Bacteroidota bacterium]
MLNRTFTQKVTLYTFAKNKQAYGLAGLLTISFYKRFN